MDISESTYEYRAQIFKALAHPTRLKFINALAEGERCVCELKDIVDIDVSTVSKHLSVLKNAGVVEDNKRGLQVFYRLRIPCVLGFMQCLQATEPHAISIGLPSTETVPQQP